MRFMVIVKGCEGCEADKPRKEFLAEMGKYNEELKKAGVLLQLEGLKPMEGARVKFDGRQRTVTDGPFAESKELLGGFWIWQCKSMDEAIQWLKRAPFINKEVELRQILEPDDFIEMFEREFQAAQRALVEANK